MGYLDRSYLDHSPLNDVRRESRSLTAELGESPTITRSVSMARTLTAQIGETAPSITRVVSIVRTLTAQIGLAASQSRIKGFTRVLTAAVGLSASLSRNQGWVRVLTATLGAAASVTHSFRPPRRQAQSATTRSVSEAVGTDRTVRATDTNTDRTVERF